MSDLHHFYIDRKDEFERQCLGLRMRAKWISAGRIVVALTIVALVYLSFDLLALSYFILPILLLFVFLVSWYTKIQERITYLSNLSQLNILEANALDHEYSQFGDGAEYADPSHSYSYDLDLLGKGSLFQYLNRCGTRVGADALANRLLLPCASEEAIRDRQQAVEELSKNVELRQAFWAHGQTHEKQNQNNAKFFAWLKGEDHTRGRAIYRVALIVFPVISLGTIGLVIYNFDFFPLLLLGMGVQLTITSFHTKMVKQTESTLTSYQKIFKKYSLLLNVMDESEFTSSLLVAARENARQASKQIIRFSKLVNALESRNNAFAYAFGNGFYLYDLQYVYQLEKWRHENSAVVSQWIDKIAEVDELISFATFYFNNPNNSFPTIHAKQEVEAEVVGHPLIAGTERVGNTFNLGRKERIMLITGANMAGKSTFLRTVGVNLVLALSGSSVCARKFTCPIIGLATSMRATDSLVEHQSYFYAELNRLKSVMESANSGRPHLVLLDEILRGTNSNDKHDGSVGLVKQFVNANALVMLASHDVELGKLAQEYPDAIRNFCFESEIKDDTLRFDFTLHEGVAKKANATFLMRQMGILPKEN